MNRSSPVGAMLDFAYGRGTASGMPRPELALQADESIPSTGKAAMLALATASKAWWESRRPQSWTLEQHLADPTVGCNSTEEEQALAEAVAASLRQGAWDVLKLKR